MPHAAGNEGPLEGYMHNTGLMFENAPQFGALIVFAEVGGSLPTSSLKQLRS